MRILITGACGFVGSTLAIELTRALPGVGIVGLDNLSRPGSERNRHLVASLGVQLYHGDIRNPSDLEPLPSVDWVIDAAANPSVLAGLSGPTSSRQLVEHNLVGTINLLEFCKTSRAGFIMLSTSRVYSLPGLARIAVAVKDRAFVPTDEPGAQLGLTALGISEAFSTQPPLSLYGRRNSRPRRSPSSTGAPSICPSSSIDVVCSPARGSSGSPTRASSPFGFTPIVTGGP